MGDDRKPKVVEATGAAVGSATARAAMQVFAPLPDGHPCYALVGLIAGETARIEYHLDVCIWELAQVLPVAGACITGQMVGMFPRYLALYQLATLAEMPEAIVKEIVKQKGIAGELAELRNRAIHDAWFQEESLAGEAIGGSFQYKNRTKTDTRFGPHPVDEESLKRDLARLRSHNLRVIKLQNELRKARRRA